MTSILGLVGPAQSEYLYHFTGRTGDRPVWVPEEIRDSSPQQRLDAILREERFRAFAPFGAERPGSGASGVPCVCFSECPLEHLDHLIQTGRFTPWGVVTTREKVLRKGGGAVAYVPPEVHEGFLKAKLGHWAVRTEKGSSWLHEQEWRLPMPQGSAAIASVQAILVEDAAWRPSKVPTGRWIDGYTGVEEPGQTPHAVELEDYPRLWRESAVWVWNAEARNVKKYEPGELC
ncbi:hypothetical protein [Streptomyces abyssomicinicus]|uniref:hypothetical protein n=1 Tax=Streptomyces abyssomicinicus TaxID=574929 RepID=UPI0012501F41|nr:hypothetical protein [Streptomyces abyssomicinicus]